MNKVPNKSNRNRHTGLVLFAVVLGMIGLAFASVPLYRLFCVATGFGGTPQRVTAESAPAGPVSDRVITMTARPGRAKETLEIQLPRPRDYEMRLTPQFNEIKSRIWEVLKEELSSGVPR